VKQILLLSVLALGGCWIVAGVDDFTDAPSGGSGGSGGSGASQGGQAGDAGGGVGGTGETSNGEPCTKGSDCRSGHCAEDVCCDAACTDACSTCLHNDAIDGDPPTGTCHPEPAGAPGDCPDVGDVCDGDGSCSCHNGKKDNGELCADCGGGDNGTDSGVCAPCSTGGKWECACGVTAVFANCCDTPDCSDSGNPLCFQVGMNGDCAMVHGSACPNVGDSMELPGGMAMDPMCPFGSACFKYVCECTCP
jgi:hypothetical protein